MKRIFVKGYGYTKVNNHGHETLSSLSRKAISNLYNANTNLNIKEVDMLICGNMLSPVIQRQSQLANKIASENSLEGIATLTIDSACSSGQAAIRQGILALLSGQHRNVLVVGVEQMVKNDNIKTKEYKANVIRGLGQAADYESEKNLTFMDINDKLMFEYIKKYEQQPHTHSIQDDFYYISKNSQRNAKTSEHALLRHKPIISMYDYKSSGKLAKHRVKLFDASPIANGAAAVLLSLDGVLGQDVAIVGSSCRNDILEVAKREDLLELKAAKVSFEDCMKQANIQVKDLDIFELHDAYSIMTSLTLETLNIIPQGRTGEYFKKFNFGSLDSDLSISTFGGLKSRGHPVGSTGVYQIIELCLQLLERAGENQVKKKVKYGITNSYGGAATNVFTHLLTI